MAKVKIIKRSVKDNGLSEMFNQMMGGEGDPVIIKEKQTKLRGLARTVASVCTGLATGPMRRDYPEYTEWCDDFLRFGERTQALVELEYEQIKDADQTRQLVLVCRELVVYAHFLEAGNLQDRWITTHPGLAYEPFAFTKMDIKHIWANDRMVPKLKQLILTTISIMFNCCHEIYRHISSPDIDVKKFSAVIVESIDKVKCMPELNRCKDAFNKIRDSVNLLENNFSDYYKDMVQSENPNTLIENFIVDVSKGQNMNLGLMRQFRQIINFYKKQSSGKVKDPKIKKLFDSLNSRMDILEKNEKVKSGAAAADDVPSAQSSDDENPKQDTI